MSGGFSPSINESMKMIALSAVHASQPMKVLFGTVVKINPLEIKIDEKEYVQEDDLVLSNLVKDHYVDQTVSFQTENDAFMIPEHTHTGNMSVPTDTGTLDTTHKHEIKHKIKVLQHYGLKNGEKVVVLRVQGGQKYFVVDRVDVPPTEGEWL